MVISMGTKMKLILEAQLYELLQLKVCIKKKIYRKDKNYILVYWNQIINNGRTDLCKLKQYSFQVNVYLYYFRPDKLKSEHIISDCFIIAIQTI